MNSIDSLPRPQGIYGKKKQTSKRSTDNSNWSAKASIISQHRMGSCNCGKSSQGKIIWPTD
jgi:hypothetical protein